MVYDIEEINLYHLFTALGKMKDASMSAIQLTNMTHTLLCTIAEKRYSEFTSPGPPGSGFSNSKKSKNVFGQSIEQKSNGIRLCVKRTKDEDETQLTDTKHCHAFALDSTAKETVSLNRLKL